MAPVPRPPIICYDLQANENPRRPIDSILYPYDRTNAANYHYRHRPPLSSTAAAVMTNRNKTKVTVIQRDPNELRQQLKLEAKEHERRAEYKRKQLEQLDKVTAQLELAKKVQENLLKTFGMSHNTARYIQKQDEDFAALRRKVDQFAVTRSKEISQRVQQMKRLHDLQRSQDRRAEEKRLACSETKFTPRSTATDYNTSTTTNTDRTINTRNITNSTAAANTSFSSSGSSSTISLSSTCSSSNTSTDDSTHLSSIDFAEPTLLKTTNITSSGSSKGNDSRAQSQRKNNSTIANTTHHHRSMINSKPANKAFSFYKGNPSARDETLEVIDMEFFEKVEDRTMMEVNDLVQKLKAEIECFEQF